MEGLSQLTGGAISKQAISKYEAAKMMPNSTNLISIAEALMENLEYFFRPFKFDIDNMNISFRKKSSVGKKNIESLKIQIQNDVENYLEIEEILDVKQAGTPCDSHELISTIADVEEEALLLRKKWHLGLDPISNVNEMLETNGIKVILTKGPDGFDGVSGVVNEEWPIMVLNEDISMAERSRFTALHETAHILFNQHMTLDLTEKEQEKLCNAFASEMLLPTPVLLSMFKGKNKISLKELTYLQENFGISIDAIMYKLKQLGLVTEKRYKCFYMRKNSNPDFKAKVEKSRFHEKRVSRYSAMVYSALAQQLISASKAASLLGIPIHTVNETVNVI